MVRFENTSDILLKAVLPSALGVVVLAFLVWWVYACFKKPKFKHGTVIYFGRVIYSEQDRLCKLTSFKKVQLEKYNAFKYRWKPTLKPQTFVVGGGIQIRPGYRGRIECAEDVLCCSNGIRSLEGQTDMPLRSPEDIVTYMRNTGQNVAIEELKIKEPLENRYVRKIDRPSNGVCYLKSRYLLHTDGCVAIGDGMVFCYEVE